MPKWTRERIIRDILRRESEQLPLTSASSESGVDHAMYQAASRIFGSWKNAVIAAGLPASQSRASTEWTPARIKKLIRSLARRKRPLAVRELKDRYGHFVAAARRHFGSWSKAVVAAGIDPQRMKREPSWSRERVIEEILTRTLRNETLQRQLIQPRSLAEAGTRIFGSWKAALTAAGVEITGLTEGIATPPMSPITQANPGVIVQMGMKSAEKHRPQTPWSDSQILTAIKERLHTQQPLYATAV